MFRSFRIIFSLLCIGVFLGVVACTPRSSEPAQRTVFDADTDALIPFETNREPSYDIVVQPVRWPAVQVVEEDEASVTFAVTAGFSGSQENIVVQSVFIQEEPRPELHFSIRRPAHDLDRHDTALDDDTRQLLTFVTVQRRHLPDHWDDMPQIIIDQEGTRYDWPTTAIAAVNAALDYLQLQDDRESAQAEAIPHYGRIVWHVHWQGPSQPGIPGADHASSPRGDSVQTEAHILLAPDDLHILEAIISFRDANSELLHEHRFVSNKAEDLGGPEDAPALTKEAALWLHSIRGATIGAARTFGDRLLIAVSCGRAAPQDCSPKITGLQATARGIEVMVDLSLGHGNLMDWRWLALSSTGPIQPPVHFVSSMAELPQLFNHDQLPPLPLHDDDTLAVHNFKDDAITTREPIIRLSGYARVTAGELIVSIRGGKRDYFQEFTTQAAASDPDWGSFTLDVHLPWPNGYGAVYQLQLLTPRAGGSHHVLAQREIYSELPEALVGWGALTLWLDSLDVTEQLVSATIHAENTGLEPLQLTHEQFTLLTESGVVHAVTSGEYAVEPGESITLTVEFPGKHDGTLHFSPQSDPTAAWLVPAATE